MAALALQELDERDDAPRADDSRVILFRSAASQQQAPSVVQVARKGVANGGLAERLATAGLAMLSAGSSSEALALLRQGLPRVLLLDASLSGAELLKVYRAFRGAPGGGSLLVGFTNHPDATAARRSSSELDFYLGPEPALDEVVRALSRPLARPPTESTGPAIPKPLGPSEVEPTPDPESRAESAEAPTPNLRPPAGRADALQPLVEPPDPPWLRELENQLARLEPPDPPWLKPARAPDPPIATTGAVGQLARLEQPPRSPLLPLVYLGALALTEVLTAAFGSVAGLLIGGLTLVALLIHSARSGNEIQRGLLAALALAPLARLYVMLAGLAGLDSLDGEALAGLVLLGLTCLAARVLGCSRRDLGLTFAGRNSRPSFLMILLGMGLGVLQLASLRVAPALDYSSPLGLLVPALVLALSRGLVHELMFRGLLQAAATRWFGVAEGVIYVTTLDTMLQIGSLSPANVAICFFSGLLLGWLRIRGGTIVLPALLHAAAAISLNLLWPLVLR